MSAPSPDTPAQATRTASASGERGLRPSGRFWLILLVLCGAGGVQRFAIRSEYLAENPFADHLRSDALTYWDWAGRIAAGDLVADHPFFSAPLYPYLLGLVRAFGGEPATVSTLQIMLDLLTAFLLALIGSRRWGSPVGLLAAGLFLLMLEPASYCLRVLAASAQLSLVCLAWLALLEVQQRGTLVRSGLAGAAVGLLALAFAPAIVCLPVLGLWLWGRGGWRASAAGRAVIAVVAGFVVIAPATLHNYCAAGEFIPISAQAGVTFAQGNTSGARGTYTPLPGISTDRDIQNLDARRQYAAQTGAPPTWRGTDRFFFKKGLAYWRSEPSAVFRLVVTKAYWFLTGRHYGDVYVPVLEIEDGFAERLRLAPLSLAWLIPTALVAVAVWLRRANKYLPELMLIGVPLLVVLVFWFSPRYRFPAVPVIATGAAWALWQLRHWRTQRAFPIAVSCSVVVAGGLAGLNRQIGFDPRESCRPDFECSLGIALASDGKPEAALRHLEAALGQNPAHVAAMIGAADVLRDLGRLDESVGLARQALTHVPDSAEAHNSLGISLARQGQSSAAAEQFRLAIDRNPDYASAHSNLGNALSRQGRYTEAIRHYGAALKIDPAYATAYYNLGWAHVHLAQWEAATEAFRQTLRRDPDFVQARPELANALVKRGEYAQAAAVLRAGCRQVPKNLRMLNDLAWLLATCPQAEVRAGAEAVRLAQRAGRLLTQPNVNLLDTTAAAFAEAARFDEAIRVAQQACRLAAEAGQQALAERIRQRLALYKRGQPFREQRSAGGSKGQE
ncbi:MAG: tetratricopeptide repeat protein [Planctomycetes bacterium]|nr:tetratricopeptide repeat protein [Planctomycetota bacterium]